VCRHLAWVGPRRSVASLVLEPAHSLLRQSYAPADMRGGGTVNADGFGAGWYGAREDTREDARKDPAADVPVRYRSARPLWSDSAFASVAAGASCTALLAAVRSATTGMPVTETAAAPFTADHWLFSHNGVVRGWPDSVADVAARLPVRDLLTLDAPTDAALLWALVRHRLRAGEDPAAVLAGTVAEVEAAAPGSRLNLLLTDGATIWGTAWDHALSVRISDTEVTVASEPMDPEPMDPEPMDPEPMDPEPTGTHEAWKPVPEAHLVVARPGALTLTPIGT